MHIHTIEDKNGDTIDIVELCSDACNRDYSGKDYQGWSGCHESEFTTYCVQCGVVIPGIEDACECQRDNVVVNRFLSAEGEKCEHDKWIQVPMSYLERVAK